MVECLNDMPDELHAKLQRVRNEYLNLMQACLTGSIYRDTSRAPFGSSTFDSHLREHGLDWPTLAQTMIGEKRLANLRTLTESVIADNIPGDLIETGVWRGGACILMRAVLYANDITDRHVWVADSFGGLPVANELQYPADAGSDFHTYEQLAVSLDEVKENFRAYGLLDEQTKFLKGWFKDTLPTAPIGQLALMRLDGDMYESTMDGLTNLYPKLSHQGYVIIDDYHVVPACKAAVSDYCSSNDIQPDIIEIDGVGVYWRKSGISEKDVEIDQKSQAIVSPEIQIASLNEAVAELSRNVIIRINQSLTEHGEDIDRLNQSLTERNADVVRLSLSLAERDADVVRLGLSLAERDAKLVRLYSSTSWRITKPIRTLKKFISDMQSGNLRTTKLKCTLKRFISIVKSYLGKSVIKKLPANQPPFQLSTANETSPKLNWEDDLHLEINDVCFNLSYDIEELSTGNSSEDIFLLGKPRNMVEKSVAIGQQQRVSKIFEMGILKGGSIVLYDQIFQLQKIAAIEYRSEPIDALTKYIVKHKKSDIIKPYYGINQGHRPSMEKILSLEFPQRDIDLIIDDASHFYEETREAFNISFPYLKEGSLYIIEDWAWAHWAGDYWQKGENPALAGKTALSNLLIELFMLAASRPDLIKDIFVDHNLIIIKRGSETLPEGEFNIGDYYLLRGKEFGAWL